jgi:hypothetical protein
VKITHITHSCFVLELEKCILVFDYYKGELPSFSRDKSIVIFVSHGHYDHYNESIFKLFKGYEKVFYVISSDIKLEQKEEQKVYFVDPDQSLTIAEMEIQTLKSTDEGVAFIVRTEEKSIYHAGDLNWWHWNGEPDDWNQAMEKAYKTEIGKIKGYQFDVSFVPLDSRLEDKYAWGLAYFAENTCSRYMFPMHFFGNYSVIKRLKEDSISEKYDNQIIEVEKEGQQWQLN